MGLYLRGSVWYYRFWINGVRYKGSTKTSDKRKATSVFARAYTAVAPENPIPDSFKREPQTPHVYLLRAGPAYKIGNAISVEVRAHDLQTGCPYPVEIVAKWKHVEARKFERQLHEQFQEKRMAGEWFALSSDDVERIREFFRRKLC